MRHFFIIAILICNAVYGTSRVLGNSVLPELAVCEGEGVAKDSHCQDGLVCTMTKTFTVRGLTFPVKQCMKPDAENDIETVNMDEGKAESFKARSRRLTPGLLQSCRSEGDCPTNFCCANYIKKCLPKLVKKAECSTKVFHGCGCEDGLECKQTSVINVPVVGFEIPIMQCV